MGEGPRRMWCVQMYLLRLVLGSEVVHICLINILLISVEVWQKRGEGEKGGAGKEWNKL